MVLTEKDALKVAYNMKKALAKCSHTFEKTQDEGFEYVLTFTDKNNKSADTCKIYFGENKSIVRELGVSIDISSFVNQILSNNINL